jgi:aspartate kinase
MATELDSRADYDRRPGLNVLKVGGSVLRSDRAYRGVAAAIGGWRLDAPGAGLVVIVSAGHGVTDALLAAARDLAGDPDPAALDLLWSTGELRSTAMLTLALHATGIDAVAANVHQAGIVAGASAEAARDGAAGVRPLRLLALLARHDVVVVPGFLARGAGDAVVSLGRGGSDLTAVLLAAGLAAGTCTLVKDVAGYFSADPHTDSAARHLPHLTYDEALAMAAAGCGLVQRAALEAARAAGLQLAIRALRDSRSTHIGKTC